MNSEDDSSNYFKNPLMYLWSIFILITMLLAYEYCRIRFDLFDAYCVRIENAIAGLCEMFIGGLRGCCKDQSPEIVITEASSRSMVIIDVEDRNLDEHDDCPTHQDAVASLASPCPRPNPKRVNAIRSPKSKTLTLASRRFPSESSTSDDEQIESLCDDSNKQGIIKSCFAKFLKDFLGIKPKNLAKPNNPSIAISGYDVDSESDPENNIEMEILSDKFEHEKLHEGKIITYSVDANMLGRNENYGSAKNNTDDLPEENWNCRTTCALEKDNVSSELHEGFDDKHGRNFHNTKSLEHQLSGPISEETLEFDAVDTKWQHINRSGIKSTSASFAGSFLTCCQKNPNHQYNWNEQDYKPSFNEDYHDTLQRSATFSGPLDSCEDVKYNRKIKGEDSDKIEWVSIHSIDEMQQDLITISNNIKLQYLSKNFVPMHVRCYVRSPDSECSDQEDDSNFKLSANVIAEVYEEGSPNVPKVMVATRSTNDIFFNSSDVQMDTQIHDYQGKNMMDIALMDKESGKDCNRKFQIFLIRTLYDASSVSDVEHRDSDGKNNAMYAETRERKLNMWQSLPAISNDAILFFDFGSRERTACFSKGKEKSDSILEGNKKIIKRGRRFAVDPKSIHEFRMRFLSTRIMNRSTFCLGFVGEPYHLLSDTEFDVFEDSKNSERTVDIWQAKVLSKSCSDLFTMHDYEILYAEKEKGGNVFLSSSEVQYDKISQYTRNEEPKLSKDSSYNCGDFTENFKIASQLTTHKIDAQWNLFLSSPNLRAWQAGDLVVSDKCVKEIDAIDELIESKLLDEINSLCDNKSMIFSSTIEQYKIKDCDSTFKSRSASLDERISIQQGKPPIESDFDYTDNSIEIEYEQAKMQYKQPSQRRNANPDMSLDGFGTRFDTKESSKKSVPAIEKRSFSCDNWVSEFSSCITSNRLHRGFIRSVSFVETVSFVTNDAGGTDKRAADYNVGHCYTSNFSDEITLDHPIFVSESDHSKPSEGSKFFLPIPGSKSCRQLGWASEKENDENADQQLDIFAAPNTKPMLRRSLILDPWPKSILGKNSKILKNAMDPIAEICLQEENEEELRWKKSSEKSEEHAFAEKSEILKMSPTFLPIPSKTTDLRKKLLVKNLNRGFVIDASDSPTHADEHDPGLNEAGSSASENVKEKYPKDEERID